MPQQKLLPHKTYNGLVEAIRLVLPEACFEIDNGGQIVIYTGMKQKSPMNPNLRKVKDKDYK